METPWAACLTHVLSASQGGVRDPSGGGRAPVPVGGEAAVPLQPQDEAPEAPPSRAHSSLRAAAAADDGAVLPPVSGAPIGAVRLRYGGDSHLRWPQGRPSGPSAPGLRRHSMSFVL